MTYLALVHANGQIGVKDIADQLAVSPTVVHRILRYFLSYDLAERDPNTRKYALGSKTYGIGETKRMSNILYNCARPYMEYLYELTKETVTLCQRFGFHNVYIGQIESTQEIHISVPLGVNIPLTVGANGLCQLAYLDEDSIDLIMKIPRRKVTGQTVADENAIRSRLKQIRANGYSFTSGERVPLSASIAVPIFSGQQRSPIGAISVAFIDSRFSDFDETGLASEIKQIGRLIERKL